MNPTKTEELAAVRQLAEHLGPDSYIGPWLTDALDYLAADIQADHMPQSPRSLYASAAAWRLETEAACRYMHKQASDELDRARATAEQLLADARAQAQGEADRARERVASAIRRAEREVWA